MAFTDDIQSRDTVLFPIIEFDIFTEDKLRVSTQGFTLENNYYNPLLLSSPSIKESIDLENRNYKISTVSLSISNVEVSGVRFSDNLIPYNAVVSIYWVSPSCTTIDQEDNNACYLAYSGIVRDINHNEKTCSITLEDISQTALHGDVPVSILEGDNVIDKYKNKPIPMVYGEVDRSPAVLYSDSWEDDEFGFQLYLLPDKVSFYDNPVTIDSLIEDEVPPGVDIDTKTLFFISKDSKYYNVLSKIRFNMSQYAYQITEQYTKQDNNSLLFNYNTTQDASTLSRNKIQVYKKQIGGNFKIWTDLENYSTEGISYDYDGTQLDYSYYYDFCNINANGIYKKMDSDGYPNILGALRVSYSFEGLASSESQCKEIIEWEGSYNARVPFPLGKLLVWHFETVEGLSPDSTARSILFQHDNPFQLSYMSFDQIVNLSLPSDGNNAFAYDRPDGREYNIMFTLSRPATEYNENNNISGRIRSLDWENTYLNPKLFEKPILHRVFDMENFLSSDLYVNVKGRTN